MTPHDLQNDGGSYLRTNGNGNQSVHVGDVDKQRALATVIFHFVRLHALSRVRCVDVPKVVEGLIRAENAHLVVVSSPPFLEMTRQKLLNSLLVLPFSISFLFLFCLYIPSTTGGKPSRLLGAASRIARLRDHHDGIM